MAGGETQAQRRFQREEAMTGNRAQSHRAERLT
jgi:hypothetical protein